ncbi:MAG: MqnA/MqnD/SBP family protein [Acidobacteriaceae bacterium]|jgi:1,4-dihydroxy-6-naphthoate synthase
METTAAVQQISIAHSPDSDDAFMFYGLATGKVTVPGYEFTHILTDIETLNQKAMREAFYDVTAISFHAYPYVQEKYALMPCGGSVGEGYGPMIVAKPGYSLDQVKKVRIAIPGTLTTANLVLQMALPGVRTEVVPFDQIIPQVLDGTFEAGLIIHEGQLTYARDGLTCLLDMGTWWRQETGLPLPLGGNAIRRDLGAPVHRMMNQALRDSVNYALHHREEALAHAMQYARDLDTPSANRFVGMYVNERTLDYGEDGKKAIRRLLQLGHERGVIPQAVHVDFAE